MPTDPTNFGLASLQAAQNMVNTPSPLERLRANRMAERKMANEELDVRSAALARLAPLGQKQQEADQEADLAARAAQVLQQVRQYFPKDPSNSQELLRYYTALHGAATAAGLADYSLFKGLPQAQADMQPHTWEAVEPERQNLQARTAQSLSQTNLNMANTDLTRNLTESQAFPVDKQDAVFASSYISQNDPGKQGFWKSMITKNYTPEQIDALSLELARTIGQYRRAMTTANRGAPPNEAAVLNAAVQQFKQAHPELSGLPLPTEAPIPQGGGSPTVPPAGPRYSGPSGSSTNIQRAIRPLSK